MSKRSEFESFFKIPLFFYGTIGRRPVPFPRSKSENTYLSSKIRRVYAISFFAIFYIMGTNEGLFGIDKIVKKQYKESFGAISGFLFCMPALIKEFIIFKNQKKFDYIVMQMFKLFPEKTNPNYQFYNVAGARKHLQITQTYFGAQCLSFCNTWMFGPLVINFIGFIFKGHFEKQLPYYFLYPFDPLKDNLIFIGCYIFEVIIGYYSGMILLGADMLLGSVITCFSFQLDYISRRIENYEPNGTEKDDIFMSEITKLHTICLTLCKELNDFLKVAFFFCFMCSTMSVCFMAFQMLIIHEFDMVIKIFLFTMANLAGIWFMCHFGQNLMDSANRVGEVAYSCEWYKAKKSFRKGLVFIIARTQQGTCIKPYFFVPLGMELFKNISGMAYQFLCILKGVFRDQL